MPFLTSSLQLTSPVFADNTRMPDKYTFMGEDVSPPLDISGTPYGTRSFLLMMHDPDAVKGDWLHWSLYNIPREVMRIEENTPPIGAISGINGWGGLGYGGPHPPPGTGTHRYIFELYALPVVFELESSADRRTLEQQLGSVHTLGHAQLTGLFSVDQ